MLVSVIGTLSVLHFKTFSNVDILELYGKLRRDEYEKMGCSKEEEHDIFFKDLEKGGEEEIKEDNNNFSEETIKKADPLNVKITLDDE